MSKQTAVNIAVFALFYLITLAIGITGRTLINNGFKPWHAVIEGLGGEMVEPDIAGNPCAWYVANRQLVCYRVIATWYGEEALPLYVVEGGERTEIYN